MSRPRLPHRHLLVAALFVAPLALGGFHPLAIAALAGLLALSAALLAVERPERGLHPGALGLGLGLLVLYTVLQLVPLPAAATAALWPAGDEVWSGALALAGRPGASRPLSLAPGATALEAAKAALLLGGALLVGAWVRAEGHRPVLTALALSALACAVVALAHRLAGLERVYDLYEPLQVRAVPVPAPLLNANHLAGLLALGAPIAAGLGLEQADRSRRLLWLVGAGVTGMACVLTLSRGGIGALALAAGLLVLLVARGRGGEAAGRARWAWLAGGAAGTLAGGFYVAREAVVAEYAGGGDKSYIWTAAWPMIEAAAPFGVGRGAFGAVFPAWSGLGPGVTYTHAENLLVQLAADQGLVGAAAFAALAVGLAVLAVRGTRRPAVAGALAGAIALVAQNMADFSVELPGVALPLVVALAAVAADRRHRPGSRRSLRLPARPAFAALAALLALGAAGAVWAGGRTAEADEERLRERASAERPAFEPELARAAVARQPADFMAPYLAGVWAFRSGGEASPLPWLARALERNPSWGLGHLWIARALGEAGRGSQAMVEYRRAAALDPRLVGPVAREAAARWPGFEEIRPLVDVQPPPLELWDAVAVALARADRAADAGLADEALLEAAPEHVGALERRARAALRAGELERARSLAARLPEGESATAVLRADVLAAGGDHDGAVAALERALAGRAEDPTLLSALASRLEAAGDRDGARAALERREAASSRGQLVGALMARAAFEERAGRQAEALHYYQRAAALGGGRGALLGVARVAEARGELVRALDALRRAGREGATDEALEARASALETRVERARLDEVVRGR